MLRDAASIEPRFHQDRRSSSHVMISGHCPCAHAQLLELIRSRQVIKVLKHVVVEIVDDDAGSVTRYQICGRRPSQGDGWRSAGGGLEQSQAERMCSGWNQQKMHGSVHRHEIVAVFVADKIGARALEARSLWPIANNNQSTPETLDRAGIVQELGQMFLPGDSANETKYNRLGIPIARGHHVGRREPPNIDKRRGVKQLPS